MATARRRLVLIEWVDSHRTEGWHVDDPATEPVLCRSVGWLVHDGGAAKTIAAHLTVEEPPQRCGEMTIPTCSIREIRTLRAGG
jgi:hypothetical protein